MGYGGPRIAFYTLSDHNNYASAIAHEDAQRVQAILDRRQAANTASTRGITTCFIDTSASSHNNTILSQTVVTDTHTNDNACSEKEQQQQVHRAVQQQKDKKKKKNKVISAQ
uniref:Mitochondrial morphogenesis protein SLD7 n=1 Tax=Lygus hesperus TaxID=30085 RepID=A0A0A9ZBL0_LYGHE